MAEQTERAREAAGGAAGAVGERAQQAAAQARETAGQAAGQARGRLRDQVDQRSTQAGERVTGTAQDLRTVGEELRKQGKDTPARLADQAAERAERLGGYLERSDGDSLLRDVEDFGRRQPWTVVAGGVALGFVASRLLKASSGERYRSLDVAGRREFERPYGGESEITGTPGERPPADEPSGRSATADPAARTHDPAGSPSYSQPS